MAFNVVELELMLAATLPTPASPALFFAGLADSSSSFFRFFFFFFVSSAKLQRMRQGRVNSAKLHDYDTHVFLGSYGGVDVEEWALLTGIDDMRDLGMGCGCTECLLSSPFESGVTMPHQTKQKSANKFFVCAGHMLMNNSVSERIGSQGAKIM